MPGRSYTIELTDDQAAILDDLAADQGTTPEALLPSAIAHGLAMIAAGVDETDLREPWDRPGADQHRPLSAIDFPPEERRPGNSDMGDDIPF